MLRKKTKTPASTQLSSVRTFPDEIADRSGLAGLGGGEGERLMEMKERRRREGGGRAADGGAAGMNGSPAGSAGGGV